MRRRPYRADGSQVRRNGSRRKELSVSEYQGNDETAALEDEEVAMPAANPAAEQASPGTMEDDETTWDD
jgi:hypothetical protein